MSGLPDWREHKPAFIAVGALAFSMRLASFMSTEHAHPLFLVVWLLIDVALVGWALQDELKKRGGR